MLVVILVGGLLVERFFCRYLCPLGAIFTILSKLRIIKIKKIDNNCGRCSCCNKSCSMGININEVEAVNSGECINCLKCVEACPRQNLNTVILKKSINKRQIIIIAILITLISGGAYYSSTYINSYMSSKVDAVDIKEFQQEGSGNFKDGIYEGTGNGFRGTTTVNVTVENGFITNIETVSTEDDMPYYNRAFNSVVEQIIENRNISVDAVTGATFSSNGIMEATAKALDEEYENNNDSLQRGHGGRNGSGHHGLSKDSNYE